MNTTTKMGKRTLKISVLLFFSLFISTLAFAYTQPIENGISWLTATQNPDGSWGSNPEFALLDTSIVLDAFKTLDVSNPAYSNGVTWLSSQSPLSTDFLSRKVMSLYMVGVDISADLSTLINSRNSDGVWGGDVDSTSTINDTTLALQALKAANYSDQTLIQSTIDYLFSTQNPDGGFGFYQGDESNVYMTALVLQSLIAYDSIFNIQDSQSNAVAYLMTKQNPDGSFGEGTVT